MTHHNGSVKMTHSPQKMAVWVGCFVAVLGIGILPAQSIANQTPTVASLSEEDLLLLLEAKRQQQKANAQAQSAQTQSTKTLPTQSAQPQRQSQSTPAQGQAQVTALPVQVPNEIDLPKLVLDTPNRTAAPQSFANTNQVQTKTLNQTSEQSTKNLALDKPVIDETGTLDESEILALESKLRQLYGEKLAQAAIVIVPSTNGVPIFDYAFDIAKRWELGDDKIDNGLLVLVAKDDREMYILTGYGLEGTLPDASVKRIIREDIAPYFKKNDYANGLMAGLNAMERRLQGDETLTNADKSADTTSSENDGSPIPLFVIVLFFGQFLLQMLGRPLGASIGAGAFFVVSLISGFGFWIALLGAIVIFMAIFLLMGKNSLGGGGYHHSRHRPSGGRVGGGFGGSSYRGGGGSFGGGGAGGSW